MGGSKNRMKSFAGYLAGQMGLSEEKAKIKVLRTDRYSVFKVGSVLAASVSVQKSVLGCVMC